MNLLQRYLPNFSGHIKSFIHDDLKNTFEIIFYDRPEDFNPVIKLVFSSVVDYKCEQHGNLENDFIDLAIGFDLNQNGYLLWTDIWEITFKASEVQKYDINT